MNRKRRAQAVPLYPHYDWERRQQQVATIFGFLMLLLLIAELAIFVATLDGWVRR